MALEVERTELAEQAQARLEARAAEAAKAKVAQERTRRERKAKEFAELMEEIRVEGEAAGLNAVGKLRNAAFDANAAADAKTRGVEIKIRRPNDISAL